MSILKTLQDYLQEYNGMRMRPISEILTDITKEQIGSYALAPSGNGKTVTDIMGNRTFENNYVFYAKESVSDEVDRGENQDFLEDFSDWLEERAENEGLPVLGERYDVESIDISNAMLFDIDEDGTGLYQVQIKLTFIKRRKEWI